MIGDDNASENESVTVTPRDDGANEDVTNADLEELVHRMNYILDSEKRSIRSIGLSKRQFDDLFQLLASYIEETTFRGEKRKNLAKSKV